MNVLRSSRGFTLIELAIVVAIIGILSTIVYPIIGTTMARARYSRAVSDMATIAQVATADFTNRGDWADDEGEDVLPGNFQPYLKTWPTPPCPGWVYDWENWLDANGNGVIQVSMRPINCRTDPIASLYNGVLFYYPIATYGNGSFEGIGGSLYSGYASIVSPPDKHIYCTE